MAGGKVPVFVFDGADIGEVVQGLRAIGFCNAGQDRTATCRIYSGRIIRVLLSNGRQPSYL